MKIALLAPVEEKVPPKKYGGTERVVYVLAEELHKLGHNVTVFASGDSKISARIVPTAKKAVGTYLKKRIREAANYQALVKVAEHLRKERFDIIHNHVGWQALLFRDLFQHPMLTTLHWIDSECETTMYAKFKDEPVVSISDSQRKILPEMNYIETVYHGLPLETFTYNPKPKDYFAFLGRLSPVKGAAEAVQVALKAGVKLIMAAKINDWERDYVEKYITPYVDGKQIIYLGEVDHARKVDLLKNAKAIISPIQWSEPFGLVNVEAMACGTPVLTTPYGSIPEIIIDGKTGFLCKDVDEMAKKIKEVDTLSRAACREHAEENFSDERMAKQYLRLYRMLARQFAGKPIVKFKGTLS